MSSTQFNLQHLLDETLNDFFSTNPQNISSFPLYNYNLPFYDTSYTSLFNIQESNLESEISNNDDTNNNEETKSNSGDSIPDLIPLEDPSNINSNINNNPNTEMSDSQSQQLTLWANLLEDYNSQIQVYQQNIQSIIHITENLLPVLRNNTNNNNVHTTRPVTSQTNNNNTNNRSNNTNNRSNNTNNRSNNNTNRSALITQLRDWFRNNELSSQYVLEFENITPLVLSNMNNLNSSVNNTSFNLTTQEIQNATELFINDSSNNILTYTTCPISLEEFRDGEPLIRINHCGHIFKAFELQRWFLRNTKCPSCRYDIRTQNTN